MFSLCSVVAASFDVKKDNRNVLFTSHKVALCKLIDIVIYRYQIWHKKKFVAILFCEF